MEKLIKVRQFLQVVAEAAIAANDAIERVQRVAEEVQS